MGLVGLIYKALGHILYFLGGSVIVLVIHVGWKIFRKAKNGWDVVYGLVFLLISCGIGYILIYFGQKIIVRGKKEVSKKRSRSIVKNTESSGNRVLYLRSFSADQVTSKVSIIKYSGIKIPSFTSEEENLRKAFDIAGSLIAISKPKVKLPELGAARIPAYDKEVWEQEVLSLMQESRIIVFRLGKTKALIWELEQALTKFDINKVVFLVPSEKYVYDQITPIINEFIDYKMPEYVAIEESNISISGIIYFRNEIPVFVPLRSAEYRSSSTNPLYGRLRITLKPYFEHVGIQWVPPPIPYKLYLWFLFHFYLTGLTLFWIGVYIYARVNPFAFFEDGFLEGVLFLFGVSLILLVPLYVGVTGLMKYSRRLYGAIYQFKV